MAENHPAAMADDRPINTLHANDGNGPNAARDATFNIVFPGQAENRRFRAGFTFSMKKPAVSAIRGQLRN